MSAAPAPGTASRTWRSELDTRFSALHHHNFRLFWAGHAVSTVGTWMQNVALFWLVYRLTDSPFLLGLLGVALFLPVSALSLVGGVVADRMDRRRLVQGTQTLHLLQALALGLWVLLGHPTAEGVLALALLQGCINAFDFPGRQSFLSELVPPEDLPNAIALNSMAFNAARLIGPAVGGVLLAAAGEEVCFLLNAVSYLLLLANLARMQLPRRPPAPRQPALSTLGEGMRYAFGTERLRNLLVLMGLVGTLGFQYVVLLPVYAGEILGVGARGYGLLMAAAGVGSVTAFVRLTSPLDRPAMRRTLLVGLLLLGAGLVIFSFSRRFDLSLGMSLFIGMGMILYSATTNMMIQTAVRDEYRGRIMSLFTFMLVGTSPAGSFLMGWMADHLGAPNATRVAGVGCILGAVWVVYRLRVLARREAQAAGAESGAA
jgi:MFS family permease